MLSRDHNILWLPESNGYPTSHDSGRYPMLYLKVRHLSRLNSSPGVLETPLVSSSITA